jgi:hypothetical protein
MTTIFPGADQIDHGNDGRLQARTSRSGSDSALWPWQLAPIETESLADAPNLFRIESLARTDERKLGGPTLAVDGHGRRNVGALLVLAMVEATALLG